jgi:hypothetical protein
MPSCALCMGVETSQILGMIQAAPPLRVERAADELVADLRLEGSPRRPLSSNTKANSDHWPPLAG